MTSLHFLSMNMKNGLRSYQDKDTTKNIEDILLEKKITIFFGQQGAANFKLQNTELLGYIGNVRTCMIYDKSKITAGDERSYKQYIREMEVAGVFPKSYLPECNYILCKMTSRAAAQLPPFQFIAICWVTEEGIGEVRSTSIFRKLCSFIDSLSKWEGLPVVATGTFRITLRDAADLVPSKFHCVGYTPPTKRRVFSFSNFFISSNDIVLHGIGPLSLSEPKEPMPGGHSINRYSSHEGPVMASLMLLEEIQTIEELCTPLPGEGIITETEKAVFRSSVSEDSSMLLQSRESCVQYGPLAAMKRVVLGIGGCCSDSKLD